MSAIAPDTSDSVTRASGVDRYLCAYTWLNPAFARYVYSQLIRPGLRAIAPAYGIDFVALARHTVAARRHRMRVIGLAALDSLLVLAGVPAIFAFGGLSGATLLAALMVVVGGAAVLVTLVGWHLYHSRTRASRTLTDAREPADAVRPLAKDLEDHLRACADANVVVFPGGLPFVGAGKPLNRWKVQIDTTRAATDDRGAKRGVLPVSAEELQKALSIAVRNAGIPDIKVHNRLFVAGRHAQNVPGLLPDPEQPPRPAVERSEIRRAIQSATETARTYLCIEKDSWTGQLVVTVFVRAVEFGTDLFIEFYAHVLLPLHPVVTSAEDVPVTAFGRSINAVRFAVPMTLEHIRRAPAALATMARWRYLIRERPKWQRRIIRRMANFNYGAPGGIRAAVAAKQREWLFAYEDEEMFVKTLRTQILKVIVKYVDDHGIDTSELERQQVRIFNQTYTIGDIKGRNVIVGDGTIFNDLAMGSTDTDDDDDDDTTSGDGGDDDETKKP